MKKNTVKAFLLLSLGLGFGFNAMAQTPEQRAEIIKHYDAAKGKELQYELEKRWEKTLQLAKDNNVPLRKVVDGRLFVLGGFTEDNQPYYKTSDNNNGPASSAITARINHIRPGGDMGYNLTGAGMTVGMWEVGNVRTTHQQFDDRITVVDGAIFDPNETDNSGHATHVACTIMGSGEGNISLRGMAYEAELLAYNIGNDASEAFSAAGQGLLISNHSYGVPPEEAPDWWQGAYLTESVQWDNLTYNREYYLPVISAGNSRNGEEPGELVGNKNSKNVMVVAAIYGVDWSLTNPSIQMSSFSTYGPTDDGRIKPDISMKGVDVRSALSTSDTAWGNMSGTSMASPGVAGTLALLQQHYSNVNDGEFMKASTLKALVIHTATEAGSNPGPDYRFGWGVIDAQRAVEIIDEDVDNDIVIQEAVLNQGETDTYEVTANGSLKVTVVWTDPAGDPVTQSTTTNKALINDLDVRVIAPGVIFPYTPWKLQGQNTVNGDNNADNVEVIEIADVEGACTITVAHKATLTGGSQKYSIIISGADENMNTGQYGFADFSVYPNPASDVLNISYGNAVPLKGSVVMYDLQGRMVRNFNELVTSINVEDLTSGMYILNIEHDGAVETRKVIIK